MGSFQIETTRDFIGSGGDKEHILETREGDIMSTNFGTGAKVRLGKGLTINLGNFESARIEVSVEVPCDMASLDRATEFASKFCEDKIGIETSKMSE